MEAGNGKNGGMKKNMEATIWVGLGFRVQGVVKIMVPFWLH